MYLCKRSMIEKIVLIFFFEIKIKSNPISYFVNQYLNRLNIEILTSINKDHLQEAVCCRWYLGRFVTNMFAKL
jgi:hypothetical protein